MRRIHLYAAFVLLAFILMYLVTGYAVMHPSLTGNTGPLKITRTETLDDGKSPEDGGFSRYLQEKFNLRGWRGETRLSADGTINFNYVRPGCEYRAVVSQAADSVVITEIRTGFRGVIAAFHRIHRFGHGFLYDVWLIFYNLTVSALIIFPITGIILWYRISRRKLLGLICLGAGFSFAGYSIVYLLLAP